MTMMVGSSLSSQAPWFAAHSSPNSLRCGAETECSTLQLWWPKKEEVLVVEGGSSRMAAGNIPPMTVVLSGVGENGGQWFGNYDTAPHFLLSSCRVSDAVWWRRETVLAGDCGGGGSRRRGRKKMMMRCDLVLSPAPLSSAAAPSLFLLGSAWFSSEAQNNSPSPWSKRKFGPGTTMQFENVLVEGLH